MMSKPEIERQPQQKQQNFLLAIAHFHCQGCVVALEWPIITSQALHVLHSNQFRMAFVLLWCVSVSFSHSSVFLCFFFFISHSKLIYRLQIMDHKLAVPKICINFMQFSVVWFVVQILSPSSGLVYCPIAFDYITLRYIVSRCFDCTTISCRTRILIQFESGLRRLSHRLPSSRPTKQHWLLHDISRHIIMNEVWRGRTRHHKPYSYIRLRRFVCHCNC